MFKKSPKNCFKPVLHSSAPVGAATIDDIQNKTCNGPILSYFNHFLLPQVDLLRGTDGEYIHAVAVVVVVVVLVGRIHHHRRCRSQTSNQEEN